MARSRWAALAAVATITLAACSGGGEKSAADGVVGDPNSGAGSAKVARNFQDLSKTLDLAVPEGYLLQPDNIGDTGPTDLEKAVRDDGGDDARGVLTRTRFVRGYQRMWTSPPDDEIASYVYQFADEAGATEYTQRLVADASAPMPDVTIGTFTVPAIAGATGVIASDPAFGSSSVLFVKGPYSVQVIVTAKTPAGLESLVTAVAEEQYSRL